MSRRMMQLKSEGASLRLPSTWEAEVDKGSGEAEPGSVSLATPRIHLANFPLPLERGDFGSGAVERMTAGDVLICLLEESPTAIGSRLFEQVGMPVIVADDFRTDGMQRPIQGQSGAQKFFHVNGRAFALYIVLGSHLSRATLVPEINEILSGIEIDEI